MMTSAFKSFTPARLARQSGSDGNEAPCGPQPFGFVPIGVHAWFPPASFGLRGNRAKLQFSIEIGSPFGYECDKQYEA